VALQDVKTLELKLERESVNVELNFQLSSNLRAAIQLSSEENLKSKVSSMIQLSQTKTDKLIDKNGVLERKITESAKMYSPKEKK